MSSLVVGVGQSDRGDDAAGPRVAALLAAAPPAGVDVVTLPNPVRLADAWEGYERVVVVDAVRSGRPPGEVTVRRLTSDGPLPARSGAGGTHGFGVAEAVELARVLGRLPSHLVLVGIEAAGFRTGAALSGPVAAAVAVAEQVVRDELAP